MADLDLRFLQIYIIICQTHVCCNFFLIPELEIRKQKGFIDKDTLLLAVEDPRPNVGSGGASLNALLVVSEYLCANAGYTVRSILIYL